MNHRPITSSLRRFLIAWSVASVLLGVATTAAVLELRVGADAADQAARALTTTASALEGFSDLPLVGDSVGDASEQVARQGARVEAASEDSRSRIVLLAIIAGLLVAIMPTVPVYVTYRVVASLEDRLRALEAPSTRATTSGA